jgi:hypothetical protein
VAEPCRVQRLVLPEGQHTPGRDRVKNADAWRVLARYGDGALVVEHLDHHGRLQLPAAYVAEHVELAYATTVHRVQGATVDTAHALIEPTLSRELLYVAVTRGWQANHLYVVTDAVIDVEVHHPPQQPRTAREVLEGVLGREAAERSATETLRDTLAAADSLATLVTSSERVPKVLPKRKDLSGHDAGTNVLSWLGALSEACAVTRDNPRNPV